MADDDMGSDDSFFGGVQSFFGGGSGSGSSKKIIIAVVIVVVLVILFMMVYSGDSCTTAKDCKDGKVCSIPAGSTKGSCKACSTTDSSLACPSGQTCTSGACVTPSSGMSARPRREGMSVGAHWNQVGTYQHLPDTLPAPHSYDGYSQHIPTEW